jgi:asparagine synthase (glutamine-hydrolysing)
MPGLRDPAFRRRFAIAIEPEAQALPRRLLQWLAAIEPPEDRAFLAHCFCDLYHHLPTLLHRHDRMGMATSMEMRVPFLENGMFDLAFHMPRRAKLNHGRGKWVVKEAAAAVLPADIVHAPKKGFPMPAAFTAGCQRLLPGGPMVDLMQWSSTTLNEVLSLAASDALFRYQVLSLELWLRLYFGGETREGLGERLQLLVT